MNFWLLNLIYFIVSFIIIFLLQTIFLFRKKKKYQDGKKIVEIYYLVNRFDLDMRKVKYTTLLWITSAVNAFIISFAFVVVINIKSFILGLLIGFVILMVLIYSIYEIVGRLIRKNMLKVKTEKKKVKKNESKRNRK